MKVKKRLAVAALVTPILAASGSYSAAHASGFAVFTHGASPLGQGNAVTAHADDPSAVFYNPALINKLKGTQVEVGTTLISTSRDFHSALTGRDFSAETTTNFPSHLYLTTTINDKLSAGIGLFNPFGLKSEWGTEWEGRYLTTKSELTTYNVNPVISYRVTPSLTVAAGVDVIFLDATLEKRIPQAAIPGAPSDVAQKFKGDGTGVGFNVGVAYDVNKDLTLGVSYRSEVEVDVDGDSHAQFVSPELEIAALSVPAKTSIKLPQQVTAGVAYRVIEPLIVEAGVRWEGWSSFDELAIRLDSPTFPGTVSRRDWDDAFGANIGAKYQLTPTVALMGGYIYGSNPIPDSTFDPTIPDADTHIFTVGTDLNFRNYRVALSYAYQKLDERTKENDIDPALPAALRANGTYDTDAHLFGVSFIYRF